MEKSASARLIEAAYAVLAREGAKGATVRAIEAQAGVPHGSVRHHFGDRSGLILGLVDDLLARDRDRLPEQPEATMARMLGSDRDLTIARYELFLMATRNETLRGRWWQQLTASSWTGSCAAITAPRPVYSQHSREIADRTRPGAGWCTASRISWARLSRSDRSHSTSSTSKVHPSPT